MKNLVIDWIHTGSSYDSIPVFRPPRQNFRLIARQPDMMQACLLLIG